MVASTSCNACPKAFAAWTRVALCLLAMSMAACSTRKPDATLDLAAAIALAQRSRKPLHVHFSQPRAPLARRMSATLKAPAVAALLRTSFVDVRLDSEQRAAEFRRWLGAPGALGSVIVDFDSGPEPDVLAVLPGFADATRYLAFLDSANQDLQPLRELRRHAPKSAAARLALGELYARQHSQARARALFTATLAADALRASALEHLARLDAEIGQVAHAREELEQARSALGDTATEPERFVLTEARVLSAERHVSAAIALLDLRLPTLTSRSEREQSLLLLGALEHELGHDTDALAHFTQLRRDASSPALALEADAQLFHLQNPEPGHHH